MSAPHDDDDDDDGMYNHNQQWTPVIHGRLDHYIVVWRPMPMPVPILILARAE